MPFAFILKMRSELRFTVLRLVFLKCSCQNQTRFKRFERQEDEDYMCSSVASVLCHLSKEPTQRISSFNRKKYIFALTNICCLLWATPNFFCELLQTEVLEYRDQRGIEFSSCTLFKCEILFIKNISHMSDAERAASILRFQTKAAQLATAWLTYTKEERWETIRIDSKSIRESRETQLKGTISQLSTRSNFLCSSNFFYDRG